MTVSRLDLPTLESSEAVTGLHVSRYALSIQDRNMVHQSWGVLSRRSTVSESKPSRRLRNENDDSLRIDSCFSDTGGYFGVPAIYFSISGRKDPCFSGGVCPSSTCRRRGPFRAYGEIKEYRVLHVLPR